MRDELNKDGVLDGNLSARDSKRFVKGDLDPMQANGLEAHGDPASLTQFCGTWGRAYTINGMFEAFVG